MSVVTLVGYRGQIHTLIAYIQFSFFQFSLVHVTTALMCRTNTEQGTFLISWRVRCVLFKQSVHGGERWCGLIPAPISLYEQLFWFEALVCIDSRMPRLWPRLVFPSAPGISPLCKNKNAKKRNRFLELLKGWNK